MSDHILDVLGRVVLYGMSCWAVWALGLLLYRLAEKFQIELFVTKQMLMQAGVQLP